MLCPMLITFQVALSHSARCHVQMPDRRSEAATGKAFVRTPLVTSALRRRYSARLGKRRGSEIHVHLVARNHRVNLIPCNHIWVALKRLSSGKPGAA